MKRYFPILLAKPSEIIALQNLAPIVKEEITPILQILNENIDDGENQYDDRLQNELVNIWSFNQNSLYLDFSFFDDVDGNLPLIRQLFDHLLQNGVNVKPVVQFNSPLSYLNFVHHLITNFNCGVCIRISNNSGDFIHFNTQLATMLARLGINETDTSVLIDLGFAEVSNHNLLATLGYQTILNLNNVAVWNEVIIASGSFLSDLGSLPGPTTNTSPAIIYRLPRFEWNIWTAVIGQHLPRDIKYSDYGTKHPYYVPAAFEGSCSIKYSIISEFVIYRGRRASEHALAGKQYNNSSAALVLSADFAGAGFSWGDDEIIAIGGRTDRPGGAAKWVQISQNHHISLLHSIL